jgi:hypothetical protein
MQPTTDHERERASLLALALLALVLASQALVAAAYAAPTLTPVAPPTRETPAPASVPAPTDPPPAVWQATPTTPASLDGLLAGSLFAEAGVGPYGVGRPFWACYDVANLSGSPLEYSSLGVFIEETGRMYASRTDDSLASNEPLAWCEYVGIGRPGTFHLWLRVCVDESTCTDVTGPVRIRIEE